MDINTLRALSTVLVALAFIGICWWAYSPKRREKFKDAAQLPFADEQDQQNENNHTESKQEESKQEESKQEESKQEESNHEDKNQKEKS